MQLADGRGLYPNPYSTAHGRFDVCACGVHTCTLEVLGLAPIPWRRAATWAHASLGATLAVLRNRMNSSCLRSAMQLSSCAIARSVTVTVMLLPLPMAHSICRANIMGWNDGALELLCLCLQQMPEVLAAAKHVVPTGDVPHPGLLHS